MKGALGKIPCFDDVFFQAENKKVTGGVLEVHLCQQRTCSRNLCWQTTLLIACSNKQDVLNMFQSIA